MGVSKRAKARLKVMKAAPKKQIADAAKLLFFHELMGIKRMREIVRLAEK
jgi:hypothetical protein